MTRHLLLILFAGSLALAACGGDTKSGVDSNKMLTDITAAEKMTLCTWFVNELGNMPGEKECTDSDGQMITVEVNTVAECAADDLSTSGCTVGQLEECAVSTNGDPCLITQTGPCFNYILCSLSSE